MSIKKLVNRNLSNNKIRRLKTSFAPIDSDDFNQFNSS